MHLTLARGTLSGQMPSAASCGGTETLDFFGIKHVLGSSYHPQSQSAVERPHREYNAMCKTFMESEKDWDLVANVFVWTIRTTAEIFNGEFSPYEVITGLKP